MLLRRWVYLHAGGCRGRPICLLEPSLIYVSCCCHLCQHTAATLLLNRGDSGGALERPEQSIIWVELWSGTSRTPGLRWAFICTWNIHTHVHQAVALICSLQRSTFVEIIFKWNPLWFKSKTFQYIFSMKTSTRRNKLFSHDLEMSKVMFTQSCFFGKST